MLGAVGGIVEGGVDGDGAGGVGDGIGIGAGVGVVVNVGVVSVGVDVVDGVLEIVVLVMGVGVWVVVVVVGWVVDVVGERLIGWFWGQRWLHHPFDTAATVGRVVPSQSL